jgi:hypothetical protein
MTTNPGVEAFPLAWPVGRPRTPPQHRKRALFKRTMDQARRDACDQVRMAGGSGVVVSTNIELRRDGFPMSGRRQPDDIGVAIYFTDRRGQQLCIACDRWDSLAGNMAAVASTIEAIRSIERWGGQQASDQAFSGFAALPPAVHHRTGQPWYVVFGCQAHTPTDAVLDLYRQLARERHPDRGGSEQTMSELNDAYAQFKRERGLT